MNTQKLKLGSDATLREALLVFETTGFGVVFICDVEGVLFGLATEGDVRRALLDGHGLVDPVLRIANRSPVCGRSDMPIEQLNNLLTERVHYLPIINGEGKLEDILFADKRIMLPVASPTIGERELRYVTDAVLSGWVSSQGKYIDRFEEDFAEFCGVKHAIAVSNGTVALHLALLAAGVEPGDEVIVPALTFIATANAVTYCGAKPVFVDVDAQSWNIDPAKMAEKITSRTKAIIPVHLYGNPCDMSAIMTLAERHNMVVIEDAAEAHGAKYDGKPVGGIGHIGCFSFFGNKILTTGEGGAVVCNDEALNEKIRILRDHGMNREKRYWHDVIGYNYRMTNLQAALGVAQLERWQEIASKKKRIKQFYQANLVAKNFGYQKEYTKASSVCWLYTLLLNTIDSCNRDELLSSLKSNGVEGRPVFYPVPSMPPYYEPEHKKQYAATCLIADRGFSLPSSVDLTEAQLMKVCETMNGFVG